MSNQLYMDESNGNGVYATKSNNTSLCGTTVTANNVSNNINVIMNAASTSAITAATTGTLPTSVSSEDLSQSLSLSEYTDADESISAPTEFLAEFLSAVMLKDYKKALKYCKLILQYEPNNSTAKEFYPLILDKLRGAELSDSDEIYNKSSSPELQSSDPAENSDEHNDNACVDEPISRMDDGADEFGVSEDNSSGEPNSNYSNLSNCGSPEESFSESLDDERDNNDNDNDDDDNEEDDIEEEDDDNSSSGDDFPIDEANGIDDSGEIVADTGRASHSSSGGEGRSDNTTHSYSSLLLEEEEEADIVPVNLQFTKDLNVHDLDVSNGNKIPSASCSDSESPTEPLTQRLAAILRSTCGVSSATKTTK